MAPIAKSTSYCIRGNAIQILGAQHIIYKIKGNFGELIHFTCLCTIPIIPLNAFVFASTRAPHTFASWTLRKKNYLHRDKVGFINFLGAGGDSCSPGKDFRWSLFFTWWTHINRKLRASEIYFAAKKSWPDLIFNPSGWLQIFAKGTATVGITIRTVFILKL